MAHLKPFRVNFGLLVPFGFIRLCATLLGTIIYMGKICLWLEGYPQSPKLILQSAFIWRKVVSAIPGWPSFSPGHRASQTLTNHVKAFPRSSLGKASQSVYMRKSCLTLWVHLTLKKRVTPRVTVLPKERVKSAAKVG